MKLVPKMKEFKQKNVPCLQFIANGASGVAGAHVQRDAGEFNRECELSWNLQPMEVLLVKEKQLRRDSALRDHVKVSRKTVCPEKDFSPDKGLLDPLGPLGMP